MTRSTSASLLDLFGPEWAGDPYPFYRTLRDVSPIHWDEWMRTWAILGHPEIVQLSRDERLSSARITDFHEQLPADARTRLAPLAAVLSDMMLFNEPPRHGRLRGLLKPGLTPRFIGQVRPLIESTANELVDRVQERGGMDVIKDFAEPLSRGVIASIAGVPASAAPLLEAWQGLLHEFFTQSTAQLPRIAGLRAAFDAGSEQRRAGAATDLFSQLIAGQLRGERLTDAAVFANFLLLIDAGQATTTHLIGNAVLALIRSPDQERRLRDDPTLVPGSVHELMRYDSSVQFTSRIALADIDLDGHHIAAGQSVTLVLGSGNRDPRRYDEPDRLDVTRRASDHLSFGHGIHYCLGASLALAEIEIAMTVLLQRVHGWRLTGGEPDWLDSINFRFLKSLPIAFETSG